MTYPWIIHSKMLIPHQFVGALGVTEVCTSNDTTNSVKEDG